MKLIYTTLFVAFSFCVSAQEVSDSKYPNNQEIPGFKLYPNPTFHDVVYITSELNSVKEITIYDVFGEIVLRDVIKSTSLNIADLSPGVYVLQVVENKKTITRKLVVK